MTQKGMSGRWAAVALVLALVTAGCFTPRPETLARQWRPLGAGGPTLEYALLTSPHRANIVWETYAGQGDGSVVRVSVEYDMDGASRECPPVAAGLARPARAFLLVEFAVSPAGVVTFSSAWAQVYSAKGYFEEYPLDAAVMADLMTRTFPLSCSDLVLPSYL